jgi:hypothetical protein
VREVFRLECLSPDLLRLSEGQSGDRSLLKPVHKQQDINDLRLADKRLLDDGDSLATSADFGKP